MVHKIILKKRKATSFQRLFAGTWRQKIRGLESKYPIGDLGHPQENFLHVADAAEAIALAVENDVPNANPLILVLVLKLLLQTSQNIIASVQLGTMVKVSWDTSKA